MHSNYDADGFLHGLEKENREGEIRNETYIYRYIERERGGGQSDGFRETGQPRYTRHGVFTNCLISSTNRYRTCFSCPQNAPLLLPLFALRENILMYIHTSLDSREQLLNMSQVRFTKSSWLIEF